MRYLPTLLVIVATSVGAQDLAPPPPVQPPGPPLPAKAAATCPECGVVRTVRSITKEIKPDLSTPANDAKPSGLVATIPFGKGAGKPQIGPSQKIGKDAVPVSQTWEVTIRLDDGRFRVMTLDEPTDLKEGDKVRVEANGEIKRLD